MRFYSTLSKSFRCQRGIALPMALLSLLVLSALTVAFSIMAASEPVLANNQLQVAQARAVAESGIERAVWALNNPSATNGIPNTPGAAYPMGTAAAVAPYDGSVATPVIMNGVQVGVFTVVVTQGAVTNERSIVATGWYPTNTGSGPKVKQKIQVSVLQSLFAGNPPPAALTVRGEIQAGGHSSVDSQSDTSCGPKPGSFSQGITEINGSARINGADGNGIANQAGDAVQYVPDATFDQYTYSNADLDALKAFAKKNHTYYQGAVSFNASNQMPNGVIFVDTVSGLNIDKNGTGTTASSDFASVDIHGNAPASADGIFHGVLIVAGGLSISGNFQMYGLVYAVNDFSYTGTGTGSIEGAVVSRNIRDTSSTTIDTNTGGNASIVWNCNYVKNGGGYMPPSFMLKSGTYKEIAG
jgi:Tfp pilus assembly protein PilX